MNQVNLFRLEQQSLTVASIDNSGVELTLRWTVEKLFMQDIASLCLQTILGAGQMMGCTEQETKELISDLLSTFSVQKLHNQEDILGEVDNG